MKEETMQRIKELSCAISSWQQALHEERECRGRYENAAAYCSECRRRMDALADKAGVLNFQPAAEVDLMEEE